MSGTIEFFTFKIFDRCLINDYILERTSGNSLDNEVLLMKNLGNENISLVK